MRLSYSEINNKLDLNKIPTKRIEHSLNPVVYEVVDLNNSLKYI